LAITVALQELVSQGHDLHLLVDSYPASLVKGLLSASRLQRRYHLAEQTAAFSVAVAGALDLALNQGKGKVLEVWMGEILKEETNPSQARRPRMSERAFAFFTSMPQKKA
jgi:hypothetical protein